MFNGEVRYHYMKLTLEHFVFLIFFLKFSLGKVMDIFWGKLRVFRTHAIIDECVKDVLAEDVLTLEPWDSLQEATGEGTTSG